MTPESNCKSSAAGTINLGVNSGQNSGQTRASRGVTRRQWLAIGGGISASAIAAGYLARQRSPVFIARNQKYDGTLFDTIGHGLNAIGMDFGSLKGKRILLKPNLVEPTRAIPHMTTHPSVIVAAAEVFRTYGATVKVGEAPGHVRDTEAALIDSGVDDAIRSVGLEFADLNYEESKFVKNRGGWSKLEGFFFPQSIVEADLVVSMPKLKTHHWVGMTCCMKNMYGTLPGIKYGWPKNVLHFNGVPETVVDINASLPPTIGIVDGIECMEGDGPILGSMKPMGIVVVGASLTATDATVARIMGLVPQRVTYLQMAGKLGPLSDFLIEQRGESWKPLRSDFRVMNKPHLRELQVDPNGPLVS